MKPVYTTHKRDCERKVARSFHFFWKYVSVSRSVCLSFSSPPPPSGIINFGVVQFRFTLLQRKVVYIYAVAIVSFVIAGTHIKYLFESASIHAAKFCTCIHLHLRTLMGRNKFLLKFLLKLSNFFLEYLGLRRLAQ